MHLSHVLAAMATALTVVSSTRHGVQKKRAMDYGPYTPGSLSNGVATSNGAAPTSVGGPSSQGNPGYGPYGPFMGTNPSGTNPTGTNPGGSCPLGTAYGCTPTSSAGPYSNSTSALPPFPSNTDLGGGGNTGLGGGGSTGLGGGGNTDTGSGNSPTSYNGPQGPANLATSIGGGSPTSDVSGAGNTAGAQSACPAAVTMTVTTAYTVTVTSMGGAGGPTSNMGGPAFPSFSGPGYNSPYPAPSNGTGLVGTGAGTGMLYGTSASWPDMGGSTSALSGAAATATGPAGYKRRH